MEFHYSLSNGSGQFSNQIKNPNIPSFKAIYSKTHMPTDNHRPNKRTPVGHRYIFQKTSVKHWLLHTFEYESSYGFQHSDEMKNDNIILVLKKLRYSFKPNQIRTTEPTKPSITSWKTNGSQAWSEWRSRNTSCSSYLTPPQHVYIKQDSLCLNRPEAETTDQYRTHPNDGRSRSEWKSNKSAKM